MPDTTNTKDATVVLADVERKAKRRTKLRSLMAGRTDTVAGIAVPAATGAALQGEAGGADVMARRKAIARIYRVLTDTPADDAGMVEDTPFTQAGVVRLLETLHSRAANEGQAGARVAAGILKFLSPKDGEAHVHGASLERLQRVAKTAESRVGTRASGGARKPGGKAGQRRAT